MNIKRFWMLRAFMFLVGSKALAGVFQHGPNHNMQPSAADKLQLEIQARLLQLYNTITQFSPYSFVHALKCIVIGWFNDYIHHLRQINHKPSAPFLCFEVCI
jgi:hypothetical protein